MDEKYGLKGGREGGTGGLADTSPCLMVVTPTQEVNMGASLSTSTRHILPTDMKQDPNYKLLVGGGWTLPFTQCSHRVARRTTVLAHFPESGIQFWKPPYEKASSSTPPPTQCRVCSWGEGWEVKKRLGRNQDYLEVWDWVEPEHVRS